MPTAEGHVRVAFGSADPEAWTNVTIAGGTGAPAPEDAAIADVNGDGHLDVVRTVTNEKCSSCCHGGRRSRLDLSPDRT